MRERNVTRSPTREVGIEGEDQEISIIPVGSHLSEFSRGKIGFAMTGLGEVTYGIGVSFRLISFCNSD
jgi:hypothetical protein